MNFSEIKQIPVVSIENEIKPFLRGDVISWFNNKLSEDVLSADVQSKDLHVSFLAKSFKKYSLEKHNKYLIQFAEMIIKAAELGLIHTGCLTPPFTIDLDGGGKLFGWYPATTTPNNKLKNLSKNSL